MTDWIDLAAISSEEELTIKISSLTPQQKDDLAIEMCGLIGISNASLEDIMFRLMVERVRPFALPRKLWSRIPSSSTSIQGLIKSHLKFLGKDTTNDRLSELQDLYRRFSATRKKITVTQQFLEACYYRCRLCGHAFSNEDLEPYGIVSPHGSLRPFTDDIKPHYNETKGNPSFLPSIDHLWPISLYGSNDKSNLVVMCTGCNNGKSNFINFRQSRPFNGLPWRNELIGSNYVSFETFYAQISQERECAKTGKTWFESELTVRPIKKNMPFVLDNLQTVCIDSV